VAMSLDLIVGPGVDEEHLRQLAKEAAGLALVTGCLIVPEESDADVDFTVTCSAAEEPKPDPKKLPPVKRGNGERFG